MGGEEMDKVINEAFTTVSADEVVKALAYGIVNSEILVKEELITQAEYNKRLLEVVDMQRTYINEQIQKTAKKIVEGNRRIEENLQKEIEEHRKRNF